MSASDDYPADGAIGGTAELQDGLYEKAMLEIDRLRAEVAYLRTPTGAFDAWSASTVGMKFVRISEPED